MESPIDIIDGQDVHTIKYDELKLHHVKSEHWTWDKNTASPHKPDQYACDECYWIIVASTNPKYKPLETI